MAKKSRERKSRLPLKTVRPGFKPDAHHRRAQQVLLAATQELMKDTPFIAVVAAAGDLLGTLLSLFMQYDREHTGTTDDSLRLSLDLLSVIRNFVVEQEQHTPQPASKTLH